MNVPVARRPVRLSTVVALGAAAAAVSLIRPVAMPGAVVLAAGFVVSREGAHRFRTGGRAVGTGGLLVGALAALVGVGLSVASASQVPAFVEVGLGTFGIACVGLGTLPVRGTGSRLFVKVGTSAVLLCIVAGGLFQDAGTVPLLVSCAALVVSWDAAENSISVGEQLGRESTTWTVEEAHSGFTALVGGVAVLSSFAVRDLGTPGLPLHSVALLLVALVFLTLALHD
ncbi:hypothetical protein ACH9L7_18180 (plasmid) [Haloferax sp. S1W]|uniref:DUF7519 family protein n=1 Tax=Haloferax sp. S1W TaxID=3377110 RepID=UPI0037C8A7BB